MKLKTHIEIALLLTVAIIVLGTLGYKLQGWDVIDALYMTVITITTVGLKEVQPLDNTGKIFTSILALFGLFVVMSGAGILATKFFEMSFDLIYWRRKMEKKIKDLKNHIIICGAGQMGEIVANVLKESNEDFLFIEKDNEVINNIFEKAPDIIILHGDATQDETLLSAGVDKAKGLISVLSTDAENLFVVLSARGLNPSIRINTKAESPENVGKMRKAGANNVISNVITGGNRMAQLMIRPDITSFLDIVAGGRDIEMKVAQIEIPVNSPFLNKNLSEVKIPQTTGLIVIAVKKPKENRFKFNPTSSTVLEQDDQIIVLGNIEQIDKIKMLLKG